MEAVIAAGASAPGELRQLGVERIPLLRCGGETLLARACRCLAQGGGVARIHLLAPEAVPLPDAVAAGGAEVLRAPYSGKLIADLLALSARLESGGGEAQVLIASADMPALTPEAVAALVAAAAGSDADIVYPVLERSAVERQFPGTQRTYRKLGRHIYTGGNIFVVNVGWLQSSRGLIERLFALRKQPLALARLLGPAVLYAALSGRVEKDRLAALVGGRIGARISAPALEFAEIGVDLDKLADYEYFRPRLDPPEAEQG